MTSPDRAAAPGLSPSLTTQFAIVCGLGVMLTQLGYGAGLILRVPLVDGVENRRLIMLAMGGAVIGLVLRGGDRRAARVMRWAAFRRPCRMTPWHGRRACCGVA